MEWDKFNIAQIFLRKAGAIHPEDAYDPEARADALALQDVYYDCYMSSFSREALTKRLNEVIAGDIKAPEDEEIDEERYRAVYMREAGKVLLEVERGEVK